MISLIATLGILFSPLTTALRPALHAHTHDDGEMDAPSTIAIDGPIDTSGAESYSNFLRHYYDNLTYNFGVNYIGTCGYVALAMMLSYFDAMWNSSFVPECYDAISVGSSSDAVSRRNSPGVQCDSFEQMGFTSEYAEQHLSGAGYLSYIAEIEDVSLHARLISIGNDLGYYNSMSSSPALTTKEKRAAILDEFLTGDLDFSSTDYSIVFDGMEQSEYAHQQSAAETAIKSYIDQGLPVLVSIGDSPYPDSFAGSLVGAHAVIAYDYDASNVYFHPGWFGDDYSTHMTREQMGYTYIRNYMVLIPNQIDPDSPQGGISISPGENYIVSHCNDSFALSYDDPSLKWENSAHIGGGLHSYTSSFVNLSEDTHKAICACGAYQLVCHDVIPFFLPGQPFTNVFICQECFRRFYGL